MKDTRFAKLVLLVNGLVPLTLLLWDVYRKQVGANPLEFVTRTTGMLRNVACWTASYVRSGGAATNTSCRSSRRAPGPSQPSMPSDPFMG